jgi:hypothetical protein
MTQDHARLDGYLADADPGGAVERAPYEQFRVGLLRHIAIEEKLLFVAIRARSTAPALSLLNVLHADHAALASLLVPSPTPALLRAVRGVLDEHNPLEECAGGLYDLYEQIAGGDLEALTARAAAIPPIRASAHVDGPRVDAHVARMLAAAHAS